MATSQQTDRGPQSVGHTPQAFGQWPAQKLSRAELARLAETGEVQSVIVATPDIHGRLLGKSMPVSRFLAGEAMQISSGVLAVDNEWNLLEGRFPDLGHANGWADMRLEPDLRSLRRLATLEKAVIVLADGSWPNTDESVAQLPRNVLKTQLQRAANQGLTLACAIEAEFYIFGDDYSTAKQKGYAHLTRLGDENADYSVLHLSTIAPFIDELQQACINSGIPVDSIKHEWGKAQAELTLTYTDALEAVDRITLFKLLTKQVARRHGLSATFMARYSQLEGGSSGHVHLSVWDRDSAVSLMADDSDPDALGPVARGWLGGQMALVNELMPLYCPYVNSYKRLRSDGVAIGPISNAWGLDTRTVPFRVVGSGPSLRIEHRIPGADANFYFAVAAIVAAGLHGIERSLEPVGEPVTGIASPGERLPRSLSDALDRFRDSSWAREVIGDEVVNHLVAMGEHELEVYESEVTDVERRRSFDCG